MTPGIYYDMPEAEYHAAPGVSSSQLKVLRRSPAHLQAYLITKREATPAQRFGSLAHRAILEPERLQSDYIVIPTDAPERYTGNAKNPKPESLAKIIWWQEFDQKTAGKEQLTQEEFDNIRRLVDRVRSHPAARTLMRNGSAEVSVFAICPVTGLPLKGRWDWLAGGIIADWKSCLDASREAFSRQIEKWAYHIQAAFYLYLAELAGQPIEYFTFVAFEKEFPYELTVSTLGERSLARGRNEVQKLLALYKDCQEKGAWPGYDPAIRTIDLPMWAFRELEDGDLIYEVEEESAAA